MKSEKNKFAWLDPLEPVFPPISNALEEPDGLLAVGGNLTPPVLTKAYSQGIFPWFSEGEPILWWSPSNRALLLPGNLHLSRGSKKQLQKLNFRLSTNTAFEQVITECARQREISGTWITKDIIDAYINLHRKGLAQSVEVWEGAELVGGLYGVKMGAMFCGESMFNLRDNAAKFAFCSLATHLFRDGYQMIDCQIQNDFLASLGVIAAPRAEFQQRLASSLQSNLPWPSDWNEELLMESLKSGTAI